MTMTTTWSCSYFDINKTTPSRRGNVQVYKRRAVKLLFCAPVPHCSRTLLPLSHALEWLRMCFSGVVLSEAAVSFIPASLSHCIHTNGRRVTLSRIQLRFRRRRGRLIVLYIIYIYIYEYIHICYLSRMRELTDVTK